MSLQRARSAPGGHRAGTDSSPEELLEALRAPEAAVRRRAAQDLAAHTGAIAVLVRQLEIETDMAVRAALFASLSRMGGAAVVHALAPLVRRGDAGLRNGAIEVLAALPADVATHVREFLADADADVRILCVNLLGSLAHTDVPQWLEHLLLHDPHPHVVGAALEVAAELGGPELVPAVRQAAQRFPADPFIAFACTLVLERIERP